MSYSPTAREGSLRRQHHGFGQVTISEHEATPISIDAAISRLGTPSSTTAAAPSKDSSSWAWPSVASPKDQASAFSQATTPGWAPAAQVPIAPSSNAPIYIAIGGAIVMLGIIMVASRRPKVAANRDRRRRRR